MEKDECYELMHNLMFEMFTQCRQLMKELMREDLDFKKMGILFLLDNLDLISMTDCSKKMGLTKSNFTFIANEMVEEGYVARKLDESDRRLIYLEITEKGRLYVKECMEFYEKHLGQRLKVALSDEDIHELNAHIKKSIAILNKLNRAKKI